MFRKSLTLIATLAALGTTPHTASAQGTDSYLGSVWLFGGTFCPRGTLEAAGQLLPISANSALFSLFGTLYGGDGRTTFGLPDLRGRSPIGQGQGPGLSNYPQGSKGGVETVTLLEANLPPHNHEVTVTINGTNSLGTAPNPAGNLNATDTQGTNYGTGEVIAMSPQSATVSQENVGGGVPVGTRSPYQTLRWCVNTVGIYPPRN